MCCVLSTSIFTERPPWRPSLHCLPSSRSFFFFVMRWLKRELNPPGPPALRPAISQGDRKTHAQSFLPPIPPDHQIYASQMPVAGIQHHKEEALRFARSVNQELLLERDPTNSYNRNAVRLIGVSGSNRYFIGYLPREIAEQIARTNLFDSIKARLGRIYEGHNGFLDIQYQLIGPKSGKATFDAYFDNKPPDAHQKEYCKFFGLKLARGLTTKQAQLTIAEHRKSLTPDQLAEWDGFCNILSEFDDNDFREINELKKVSQAVLNDALNQLRQEGKSYSYLSNNTDDVADRVLKIKPELRRSSSD